MSERLTARGNNGYAYFPKCFEEPCLGLGCVDDRNCPEFEKWCNKLTDYEDLEEQGLLLKLPCAIGDMVYEVYEFYVCGVWHIKERKICLEDIDKIGETVFVTREEAEAKLSEMRWKNG